MPILLLFFLLLGVPAQGHVHQILAWNFDWDDNICRMATKIVLFDKKTGEELGISTAEFAHVRETVGKSGKYAGYELRSDPATGSYRYFRDAGGKNYFLEDLKRMVETGKPEQWQGPSWKAFVEACSRPETARWTTIITARGHEPESMLEGLKYLRDKGFIKYVPLVSHLFAVGHPKYAAEAASPSLVKTAIMKKILDRIAKRRVTSGMPLVLNREGTGFERLHLWGFSDDDYGNFEKAVAELSAGVKAGKWAHVKITVFFTGADHPKVPPHAVVIQPDGRTRPVKEKELSEVARILYRERVMKVKHPAEDEWLKACLRPHGGL